MTINGARNSAAPEPRPHRGEAGRVTRKRAPTQRSRISNGSQLFLLKGNASENSVIGRRLKDLIADITSDLGGFTSCSTAELALINAAAHMQLQLELMQNRWGENGGEASEKSLITYQRTASALRRILKELGLQRRAKVVGPSLGELLHQDAIHQQRAHTERSEAQRQEFEKRQSSRDQEAQS